jgi:hypothetical protein
MHKSVCGHFSESGSRRVELDDVDPVWFQHMLDLWCGRDGVEVNSVRQPMRTAGVAELFQVEEVVSALEDALVGQLSVETCAEVLMGGERPGLRRAEAAAEELALARFEEVAGTELKLDTETLENRLQRFLSTEQSLCRMASLCAHVQEALQSLILSGRRFDATYRALRRQHRRLDDTREAQLRRAAQLHARGLREDVEELFEGLFADDPSDPAALLNYTALLLPTDPHAVVGKLERAGYAAEGGRARPSPGGGGALAATALGHFEAELHRTRAGLFALHDHVHRSCAGALGGAGFVGTQLAAIAAAIPSARGWTLRPRGEAAAGDAGEGERAEEGESQREGGAGR